MNFGDWLNKSEIDNFFQQTKKYVIRSVRPRGGGVSFRFPNFQQLSQLNLPKPSVPQVSSPTALVAHANYDGKVVSERREGTTKDVGAEKSLKSLDPNPPWEMEGWEQFRQAISTGISKVAAPMGFLFEIEIILYLMTKKQIKDKEEIAENPSRIFFSAKQKRYAAAIQKQAPQAASYITHMVQIHAADLSEQIYKQTAKILGANPDQLQFTGGGAEFTTARANPADLILFSSQVSGRSSYGWNVKFTGETRTQLQQSSVKRAFKMLGGRGWKTLQKELESTMIANAEAYNFMAVYKKAVNSILFDPAEANFQDNAPRFARLLNDLISGRGSGGRYDTGLAIRNYASTSMGGAVWSKNIQKDFIATSDPKAKLKARPDATVDVNLTKTYVKLTYKVPGGSFSGTSITFEPRYSQKSKVPEIVKISATNLTTERR